jgi:hypothetical protein
MATALTALIISLAIGADDSQKPFWLLNYERGVNAMKLRKHAETIRSFNNAIPDASKDTNARDSGLVAEMHHGVGVSYKALAEGEHAKNSWK